MFNHSPAEPTAGGASLLPDGEYKLKIVKTEEKKTQKDGFPMVNVTCEVVDHPELNGRKVFHNVTFLPKDRKGAGMSTHFLKCINQAWEGDDITVDPIAWEGEKFKAKIGNRKYTNSKGVEVESNDIKGVESCEPF